VRLLQRLLLSRLKCTDSSHPKKIRQGKISVEVATKALCDWRFINPKIQRDSSWSHKYTSYVVLWHRIELTRQIAASWWKDSYGDCNLLTYTISNYFQRIHVQSVIYIFKFSMFIWWLRAWLDELWNFISTMKIYLLKIVLVIVET
jgi:hypothetical protein